MSDLEKELDDAIANKDFTLATAVLNKMWLTAQIDLAKVKDPTLKELTFLKTPVDTGNGKYLLLFIHVDGEKIQLQGEQSGK